MNKNLDRFLPILLFVAILCSLHPWEYFLWSKVKIDEKTFPDSRFRYYISDNFDLDGDRCLSEEEIRAAEKIDLSGETQIKSLRGVEYFTALKELDCTGLQLQELDLRSNSQLVTLRVPGNKLSRLDLSSNPLLEYLDCAGSALTSLSLAESSALQYLNCSGNQLDVLDLTGLTALQYLDCSVSPSMQNHQNYP